MESSGAAGGLEAVWRSYRDEIERFLAGATGEIEPDPEAEYNAELGAEMVVARSEELGRRLQGEAALVATAAVDISFALDVLAEMAEPDRAAAREGSETLELLGEVEAVVLDSTDSIGGGAPWAAGFAQDCIDECLTDASQTTIGFAGLIPAAVAPSGLAEFSSELAQASGLLGLMDDLKEVVGPRLLKAFGRLMDAGLRKLLKATGLPPDAFERAAERVADDDPVGRLAQIRDRGAEAIVRALGRVGEARKSVDSTMGRPGRMVDQEFRLAIDRRMRTFSEGQRWAQRIGGVLNRRVSLLALLHPALVPVAVGASTLTGFTYATVRLAGMMDADWLRALGYEARGIPSTLSRMWHPVDPPRG